MSPAHRCQFLILLLALSPLPLRAASRIPVRARHGMVVCAESLATETGVSVLRNGGNAIDAAVAVGFTLAVTYPEAGSLGGGGFILIRLANGTSTMIDFREKAPLAATRTMYLDSTGAPIAAKSLVGPLAAGVSGTVAGLLLCDHFEFTSFRRGGTVLLEMLNILERFDLKAKGFGSS